MSSFSDRFQVISKRMRLDFEEAGLGKHNLTKGQNREGRLRAFLKEKLPGQYGVGTGEIIYRDGGLSPQTDIVIYDKLKCPVLYAEESLLLPIDGTHGIIEVKSYLGREELRDAALKIKNYKEHAPRDLAILKKTEHLTLARPARPFGIVFAYQLKSGSLESLSTTWMEINEEVGLVNNWVNLISVLGEGLIFITKPKPDGTDEPLIDTDALVQFTLAAQEGKNDGNVISRWIRMGDDSLMWFYFYLNVVLSRTPVLPVDIGRYINPSLPPMIHSVL